MRTEQELMERILVDSIGNKSATQTIIAEVLLDCRSLLQQLVENTKTPHQRIVEFNNRQRSVGKVVEFTDREREVLDGLDKNDV